MTTRLQFESGRMRLARALCGVLTASLALLLACSTDGTQDPPGTGSGGSAGIGATGGTAALPTSGTGSSAGTTNHAGSSPVGGGGTAGAASQAGNGNGGQTAGSGAGGSQAGAGGSRAGAGGSSAGGTSAGGTSAGGLMPGNPPVLSAGCGKATTVTNGKKTIKSSNVDRTYIIDIPTDYNMNTPHRLFYTSHWINAKSEDVVGQNYYFLKPLAAADKVPAIFVAPQSDDGTWDKPDHALFDDILAYVEANLCIDTTRVFATGFSFGGMITYSLSVNHQNVIRAAVGIAPANYNIYVPPKTHAPIAWMQTTGMSDGTCPWISGSSTTNGAKFIAIEHATDNGCMVPTDIPIWKQGNHVCYDFMGCKAGYPTKVCTFNGGHTNIANEGGKNWIPEESWQFFKQF
ncbi:MAG TPA: hypothetical protein VHM25_22410 [Polyangiaceae bacterium]|nr:hypothetical protein [Polyangiaceae bacterium]